MVRRSGVGILLGYVGGLVATFAVVAVALGTFIDVSPTKKSQ
jgi:hypothetical protein